MRFFTAANDAKLRKFHRQSGVHRRQAGGALADGEL